MKIKVGNKNYELNFGIGFVRELDQRNGVGAKGVKFGMGLTKTLYGMRVYDPACLSDILYSATWADSTRPMPQAVDRMLESENTDIEKLFDDVTAELSKANAVKLAVKNMKA